MLTTIIVATFDNCILETKEETRIFIKRAKICKNKHNKVFGLKRCISVYKYTFKHFSRIATRILLLIISSSDLMIDP